MGDVNAEKQEVGVLNWAARYYPILRILKTHGLDKSGTLLEIGSGSVGIGRFRKVSFTGCDISFPVKPKWPMSPVVASATELPFKDKSFDVVVASDVLEHIPPDLRETVINEAIRVAKQLVIFGFPAGQLAWESDRALLAAYIQKNRTPPEWLTEHMQAPFPDRDAIRDIHGWDIQRFGNESIQYHSWMMRQEMSSMFVRLSRLLMRAAPFAVEYLLRKADHDPCYRQIFALIPRDIA